jgi:lauroyl/myristoyl acyltransferase
VRTVLGLLEEGQVVAFSNDFVYPGVASIGSPLFGRTVPISRGMISITLKTEAAVVPFAIASQWPLQRGDVRVEFFPQVPLRFGDKPHHGHQQGASFLFGLTTECLIRRYPAQWRLWNTLELRWQQANVAA